MEILGNLAMLYDNNQKTIKNIGNKFVLKKMVYNGM